jgi:hypothetical protein
MPFREHIDRLSTACDQHGVSFDGLFALPVAEVVTIAQTAGMTIEDLCLVCELLSERLHTIERQLLVKVPDSLIV